MTNLDMHERACEWYNIKKTNKQLDQRSNHAFDQFQSRYQFYCLQLPIILENPVCFKVRNVDGSIRRCVAVFLARGF